MKTVCVYFKQYFQEYYCEEKQRNGQQLERDVCLSDIKVDAITQQIILDSARTQHWGTACTLTQQGLLTVLIPRQAEWSWGDGLQSQFLRLKRHTFRNLIAPQAYESCLGNYLYLHQYPMIALAPRTGQNQAYSMVQLVRVETILNTTVSSSYIFETKYYISKSYTNILHDFHQGYLVQVSMYKARSKSPHPPTELGKNITLLRSYVASIRRKKIYLHN